MPALTKIADVTIGTRHRKELGDIDGLALSLRAVGLLHPIILNSAGELVAGERRLAAAKMLGWKEIETKTVQTLDDLAKALRAERDENICRKDFTPTEAVKMAEAYEPFEKQAATERKKEHGKTAPGKPKITPANLAEVSDREDDRSPSGETRDRIAEAVGMRRSTLDKAKVVVAAAKADPLHYGDLPHKMDRSGKVDPVFKEAQERADAHPVPSVPKLIPRQKTAGERFHRTLSDIHREFIAVRENHGIAELTVWWSDEERIDYAKQLREIALEATKWAEILEQAKCQSRKTA